MPGSALHFSGLGPSLRKQSHGSRANSRYLIGTLRLNASADAARRRDFKSAAENAQEADNQLRAAKTFYEQNGMAQEAAQGQCPQTFKFSVGLLG